MRLLVFDKETSRLLAIRKVLAYKLVPRKDDDWVSHFKVDQPLRLNPMTDYIFEYEGKTGKTMSEVCKLLPSAHNVVEILH